MNGCEGARDIITLKDSENKTIHLKDVMRLIQSPNPLASLVLVRRDRYLPPRKGHSPPGPQQCSMSQSPLPPSPTAAGRTRGRLPHSPSDSPVLVCLNMPLQGKASSASNSRLPCPAHSSGATPADSTPWCLCPEEGGSLRSSGDAAKCRVCRETPGACV